MAEQDHDALVARLTAEQESARVAFHNAVNESDNGFGDAYARYREASSALLRVINPPAWQAEEITASWSTEDTKKFLQWMLGYNSNAVLLFEPYRRGLNDVERREDEVKP